MSAKKINLCSTYDSSLKTEIGLLKISCCFKGVHSISICEKDNMNSPSSQCDFKKIEFKRMTEVVDWLKWYFDHLPSELVKKPPVVCPSVLSSKGSFTEQVWTTLVRDVASGSTITYGGLAAMCGRAGAARAVGTAMRMNPVPLVIPCHRVVRCGNGGIGHYSGGGTRVKEFLLRHEGALN